MGRARTAASAPLFLDPATLARIDTLELVARTVVDGFINGLHRAPYLGRSMDFAEHRPYNPGDDIRRIDWRVWGRTDRYYVKEFEADTNTNFTVLLDVSRSMDYGSGAVTKLDYARYLAACLAYFSAQQRDRVGLVTFDRDVLDFVPPAARHLKVVLHSIDRVRPGGARGDDPTARQGAPDADPVAGGLAGVLRLVAERVRRRGIVVLVSDFYDRPDGIVDAVRELRHRGSDVIVFHVLDPAELELPFEEPVHVEDRETGARIPVVPEQVRERYQERLGEHLRQLSRGFGRERIDYALFDTATPLDYALYRYLTERERLGRVR